MKNSAGRKTLKKSKFHFVGIGGIGMCGLAELLHNMGAIVTGSDLSENSNTEHLKKIGIEIFKGHRSANVGNVDVVVCSSAVTVGNPEVAEARGKKIPVIARAEALAEIMRLHRGVAVGGTHGKTTTTSMAAAIFLEANLQPTIVVGGRFDMIQSTALLGKGEWLIAEADESDGSFSKLSPEIAIITNIDSDHLDYFKSFENLQNAFLAFASRVPFYGSVIACGDDPVIRKIFSEFPKHILFYGYNAENDFVVSGSNGQYQLHAGSKKWGDGKKIGEFEIQVPGRHNALNATAALIAGLQAGIPVELAAQGLGRFQGVDRRFHLKGESKSILIYDDYGHHPTEVRATLQGFRERFPEKRLVVLFQPHRYSRTQLCWDEFASCFVDASQLIVTDIYGVSGEVPLPGINAQALTESLTHPQATFMTKDLNLASRIQQILQPGDLFVTLGAGDVWKVGIEILEGLRKNASG